MENNNKRYNEDIYNSENKDFRSYAIMAQTAIQQGNLKEAEEYFNKIHSVFGIAYCKFLSGDITNAKMLLSLIKNSSPAVNWLLSLIGILSDNIEEIPTYLEIKVFYEQDLDMLFRFGQNEFAEKIIKNSLYFEKYNREVYKYVARVLMNHGDYYLSEKYLKKSLNIFYNDPETHFMLGEVYIKQSRLQDAKEEFQKSNNVDGGYHPAKTKLKELSVN